MFLVSNVLGGDGGVGNSYILGLVSKGFIYWVLFFFTCTGLPEVCLFVVGQSYLCENTYHITTDILFI